VGINGSVPAPMTLAAGRLGRVAVTGIALAAATPLTPATLPHPLLLAAAGLLLLIFSSAYGGAARRLPPGGALHSVVTRGLGRPLGLAAAWLALAAYLSLQICLFALARGLLDRPWWMVAGACWAVVTLGGLLRIDVTAWLLTLAVIAQIVLTVPLSPIGWRTAIDPSPLLSTPRPELGLLLLTAALAFAGFETAAAHGGSGWFVVLLLTLLYAYLAIVTPPLPMPAVATGLLAGMLALHHAITRYLVALGRERVFPPFLARPRIASLMQSLVVGGLVILNVDVRRLTVAGGLALLLLLLGVALATLLFLNRHPAGEGVWRRLLAPVLAVLGFGTLGWLAYENHRYLLIAAASPILIGLAHALALRLTKPVVYAGIGFSGQAVVVAPSPHASPPPPAVPHPRSPGAHRPERVNRKELTS
jgi:amino acid transporter